MHDSVSTAAQQGLQQVQPCSRCTNAVRVSAAQGQGLQQAQMQHRSRARSSLGAQVAAIELAAVQSTHIVRH